MTSSNALTLAAVLACGVSAACATKAVQSKQPEGEETYKSYVFPVVEIVAMDTALNLSGRLLLEPATFEVSSASLRRNLRGPWVVDDDPFAVNQFWHPYQGAMYHSIARSTGHGYWASTAYTFAGSAMWEIAGETTAPSRNDQIASGIAGSFLGESLFRASRLLLEGTERPSGWRRLGSVLVSPPTGINDLLVGDPAGSPAPDTVPFADIRVQLGTTAAGAGRSLSRSSLTLNQPTLALSLDYGYPGNAGYRYRRPFDYFRIESSVSSDGLEQLSTRGLIAGTGYGAGRVAGVWGLYGTYDYFTPDDFRLSTTAGSFGTTLQTSITESLVMQSSGLLGAGFAAARALGPSDGRDYHYGVTPQALVNLRLIAGRRAAVDLTARQFFISGLGEFGTGQSDLIFVGDGSLALRVYRRNALSFTYQLAGRSTDYLELPKKTQSRSRVGVFYTFLGSGGFGAVPYGKALP
jgi:hypothetical protein